MKWITNTFDINNPTARRHFVCFSDTPEGMEMEWQEYKEWYGQHIVGRPLPQQPDSLTTEDLEKMGLIGLYKADETET